MKSITNKMLIFIGITTVIFSAFILYQTYSLTNRRVMDLVEQQASMALKFDLAIRQYVARNIRPVMYKLVGKDEFMPETMSTSYIARNIFEDVSKEFPDYIIKFSSDNPRNPANQAGPEELEIIDYLNSNPQLKKWEGIISIDGSKYMAKFSTRRMKVSCLRCHGKPEDAPASLLKQYGSTAGFHRPIGQIIGLDTVAIPLARITEKLHSESIYALMVSTLCVLLFFLVIALIFKYVIINRLSIITRHFDTVANQSDYTQIQPVKIKGSDEINQLASSFNILSNKLKDFYASLDLKVKERTNELELKNKQLQHEIDDRIRAEKSLQQSEKLLRATLESTRDGILVVDEKGTVTHANKQFAQIWKIPDELVNTKDDNQLLNFVLNQLENPEEFIAKVQSLYNSSEEDLDTIFFKDGRVVERFSCPLLRDNNNIAGRVWSFRDLTAQKKSETEKIYLEERLARSQKMEALGLLAGGVAHDLNNVLSGIVSYPDLILMDLPDDSSLRKPIHIIQDSGKKAAAIVQDLLTLARRGVTNTQVVNINDIIFEYIASPEHSKLKSYYQNIEVITQLEIKLMNIRGSSIHLKKTIMNLISNAAEALLKGGKIVVSTENRYIDTPIKGYDEVQEGDFVVLKVEDNGIGIDPEDLKKIFEPFYTKKVMGRSGTGLGMSVVWGTVQDHHGYINVDSYIGKGTLFELFFPVTREEVGSPESIVPVEDYLGHGESVLIVDDVAEQREIASDILTKLGYAVTTVPSGEDAVAYLKNNSMDILVLDMIMDPGIDGMETYKRILKFNSHQKAIIASGFAETRRVKQLQRMGAGQYIKKPYTLEKIGRAVKDELTA